MSVAEVFGEALQPRQAAAHLRPLPLAAPVFSAVGPAQDPTDSSEPGSCGLRTTQGGMSGVEGVQGREQGIATPGAERTEGPWAVSAPGQAGETTCGEWAVGGRGQA